MFVEASFSSLKQLSAVKSQHVPQLLALIPYIDMVPNQEYLIQRIRGMFFTVEQVQFAPSAAGN